MSQKDCGPKPSDALRSNGTELQEVTFKEAEKTLAAQLRFLQVLIDAIPSPVFYKDVNGRYQGCNRAFANYWGLSKAEVIGKTVYETAPKELADKYNHMDQELLQNPGTQSYEFMSQTPDGTQNHVIFTKATFTDTDGRVAGLIGVMTDITEMRKAEQEIARLATFPKLNPNPLLEVDLTGTITFHNDSALQTAQKFGLQDLRSLLPADLGEMISAARGQDEKQYYREIKVKDMVYAEHIDFLPQLQVLRLYLIDITARKRAEEARRISEERYRMVADYTYDMEYWISPDGEILYMSPSCERLTGYPAKAFLDDSQLLVHIVHPEDRPFFIEHMKEAHTHAENYNIDFRVVHRNGRESWVNHICQQVFGTDGLPLGRRVSNRDITKRILAEEALAKSLEQRRMSLEKTVAALATTLELRDPYTTGHQVRVTQLACAIGEAMALSAEQIEGLRMMGFLHDIGKITVPSEILSKPGKITENEFAILKTHPEVAYEILKEVEFPGPVAQAILQHHERLDGSGYPSGLKDQDIILEARILAVADVVESIASQRPYRSALGIDKALDEITKNKGTLYDAEVVDVCVKLFIEEEFRFEE